MAELDRAANASPDRVHRLQILYHIVCRVSVICGVPQHWMSRLEEVFDTMELEDALSSGLSRPLCGRLSPMQDMTEDLSSTLQKANP